MEIRAVGVTGLLCILGDSVCEETGAAVSALAASVRRASLPGVVELIPSFTSLLIRYDPLLTDPDILTAALQSLTGEKSAAAVEPKVVEIPVCYGGEYGPDLAYVAEHAGMSEEEVIALHSGRTYRIYMGL